MVLKLYMMERSPAVRSVLLTAKALGVSLEHVEVDLTKGEHLTPEFIKNNPQHTVPTLEDDGKIIWDSHAINIYLVTKYGKDKSLYPEDPYKRAVINQRLHFESGVLFTAGVTVARPVMRGTKTVPPEGKAALEVVYGFMEKFLEGQLWIAGDCVILADLSLIPSITTIQDFQFPNVVAWIKRAEALSYYEENRRGLDVFKIMIRAKLSS